ncbi:hypothetical protein [Leptolyngbya sp. FACHB-16]|uniref:hypothetical protein n=1 Tax=unclassified Leptolyngbya TaxID=2650499 RepID=UPI00168568BF|nr:hypothetical protein [Leptolyngbya sp. FACHB-16]MBD2153161.1 hypothetical protein [Leptolyngbya sp. FACHB-16]
MASGIEHGRSILFTTPLIALAGFYCGLSDRGKKTFAQMEAVAGLRNVWTIAWSQLSKAYLQRYLYWDLH